MGKIAWELGVLGFESAPKNGGAVQIPHHWEQHSESVDRARLRANLQRMREGLVPWGNDLINVEGWIPVSQQQLDVAVSMGERLANGNAEAS
jgi:hypothetical protein